jgi:hypothetical protein
MTNLQLEDWRAAYAAAWPVFFVAMKDEKAEPVERDRRCLRCGAADNRLEREIFSLWEHGRLLNGMRPHRWGAFNRRG